LSFVDNFRKEGDEGAWTITHNPFQYVVFNCYHTVRTFTGGSKAEARQPRSASAKAQLPGRTRTQAEQVGGSGRAVELETAKPLSIYLRTKK
jgi:hypothetical protein